MFPSFSAVSMLCTFHVLTLRESMLQGFHRLTTREALHPPVPNKVPRLSSAQSQKSRTKVAQNRIIYKKVGANFNLSAIYIETYVAYFNGETFFYDKVPFSQNTKTYLLVNSKIQCKGQTVIIGWLQASITRDPEQ